MHYVNFMEIEFTSSKVDRLLFSKNVVIEGSGLIETKGLILLVELIYLDIRKIGRSRRMHGILVGC